MLRQKLTVEWWRVALLVTALIRGIAQIMFAFLMS